MKILGIHSGHGCGVALLENGTCCYAASEERFARKKVIFGFPQLSIEDCLRYCRLRPSDIDRIAISIFNPPCTFTSLIFARLQRLRHAGWKSLFFFEYPNENKPFYFHGFLALILNLLALTGIPTFFAYFFTTWLKTRLKFGWKVPIDFVGHHECHALAAVYYAGEQPILSIVSEGYDGEASLKYDLFDESLQAHRLSTSPMPHSPGDFYNCPTFLLGYNFHKHCGKITGLAAFGNPSRLIDKVRKLMWEENGQIKISPQIALLCSEYAQTGTMPDYFKGESPADISAAFQKVLEETQIESFESNLKKRKLSSVHVALSGGTFANVRLNQCFVDHPEVASVFVLPPMADEGQPLGAALVSAKKHDAFFCRPAPLSQVYWGPDFTDLEIEQALKAHRLEFRKATHVEKEIAVLLHEGFVVARFNGRMEFGPRALGNRSILARPTDPAVNDWLNKRLRRTEFMPFAPSVLDRSLPQLFKGPYHKALHAAEFMTITFDCTDWMKQKCPAVVHCDGTARPQIVTPKSNPSFYKVIEEYEKLSGLPVVINTSFNMHEEPIVCTPDDAIRAFLQGHLDVLAISSYLVFQKNMAHPLNATLHSGSEIAYSETPSSHDSTSDGYGQNPKTVTSCQTER